MDNKYIKANIQRLETDDYLEKETRNQLNHVININKLGFITDDSQDGTRSFGSIPIDVPDYISKLSKLTKKYIIPLEEKEYQSIEETDYAYQSANEKVQTELSKQYNKGFHKGLKQSQRAYLTGFMRKDLAFVFHYLMNANTDKICMTSDYERIPVTYQISSSPLDPTYPFRNLKLHKKYLQGSVPSGSNIGFLRNKRDDKYLFYYLKTLIPSKTKNLAEHFTYISCLDPVHGREATSKDGLFTDIISILKQSHKIILAAKK